MKVHVLHIEYKYGDIYTAHSTKAKANAALYEYVKFYWNETGPGTWDESMPKNRQEAIDLYFHESEREFVNVVPLEVDSEKLEAK
jgi:hypothetical protein